METRIQLIIYFALVSPAADHDQRKGTRLNDWQAEGKVGYQ
jgi:hypothetical protein